MSTLLRNEQKLGTEVVPADYPSAIMGAQPPAAAAVAAAPAAEQPCPCPLRMTMPNPTALFALHVANVREYESTAMRSFCYHNTQDCDESPRQEDLQVFAQIARQHAPCANSVVRSAVGRWRYSAPRSALRLALRPSIAVYLRGCGLALALLSSRSPNGAGHQHYGG